MGKGVTLPGRGGGRGGAWAYGRLGSPKNNPRGEDGAGVTLFLKESRRRLITAIGDSDG